MFIDDEDYFCCYNVKLFKYLTDVRDISYLATEKNEKDDRIYVVFERNNQLSEAIRDYKELYNL